MKHKDKPGNANQYLPTGKQRLFRLPAEPVTYIQAEPILEFADEAQAYECLKEWRTRLFLDDWTIMVRLLPLDQMTDGALGHYNSTAETSGADIEISVLTDEEKETQLFKHCHEAIMIHELLHLAYMEFENSESTVPNEYYKIMRHRRLEQTAKSLLMAKYNLTFDWFKNF